MNKHRAKGIIVFAYFFTAQWIHWARWPNVHRTDTQYSLSQAALIAWEIWRGRYWEPAV